MKAWCLACQRKIRALFEDLQTGLAHSGPSRSSGLPDDFLTFQRMIIPLITQVIFWMGASLALLAGILASSRPQSPRSLRFAGCLRRCCKSFSAPYGPHFLRAANRFLHERDDDRNQEQHLPRQPNGLPAAVQL